MRAPRIALVGLLGLLACGPTGGGGAPAYDASFEDSCGGLPCDWEQTAGSQGAAALLGGALPGAHALALRGSGTTVRGPAAPDPVDVQLQFGSLEARLEARCDEGASLVVGVALVEVDDAGTPTGRADTLEGRASPPTDFGTETRATLTASSALADGGLGSSPFGGPIGVHARISAVTLSKTGPGECVIDELRIGAFGTLDGTDPGTRC